MCQVKQCRQNGRVVTMKLLFPIFIVINGCEFL